MGKYNKKKKPGLYSDLKERHRKEEKNLIFGALEMNQYVKQKAADFLGMNRTTLVEWCKAHAPELINKG